MDPKPDLDGGISKSDGRRRLGRYVTIVAGIPLASLPLAFFLLSTPFFQKYCDLNWIQAQNQMLTATGRSCDIVMFGDSTAELGLDPQIISERTHLTACNIALGEPVLEALGTKPLEAFLERNGKPKVLLLQFAPKGMRDIPESELPPLSADVFVAMLRFGYIREALARMFARPAGFIAAMNYTYDRGFKEGEHNVLYYLRHGRVDGPQLAAGSYFAFDTPGLTGCLPMHDDPLGPKNIEWIQALRKRFASSAQTVIINSSPISPCSPFYQQWSETISGFIDSPLKLYPLGLFWDQHHTTREGAIRLSEETAQQILALENQSQIARAAGAH